MSFCVAQPEGTKSPRLYQIKQTGGKVLGKVADHTRYGDGLVFQIAASEILVHLGDEPALGSVYGCWVEPVSDHWLVKGWGEVFNFVPKLSDSSRERIKKALVMSKTKIARQFPDMPVYDIRTEIRHPKGRVLGSYRYSPKDVDVLTLRPNGEIGARELVKLITHELGHGVWHRGMTPEGRARWIKTYEQYVKVSEVSAADVKRIVRSIRQMESLRDYLKECEPEDLSKVHIWLGWLRKIHSITAREVQDLVSAGEDLPVPDTHLHKSDVSTPITLYSTESPSELFCETVSSHMVGDLSDKRLIKLLGDRR